MAYTVSELRNQALWGECCFKKIPVKVKPKPEPKTEWRGEWCWMLFPVNEQITLELCIDYKPQEKPKPLNINERMNRLEIHNNGLFRQSFGLYEEEIWYAGDGKVIIEHHPVFESTRTEDGRLIREYSTFRRVRIV